MKSRKIRMGIFIVLGVMLAMAIGISSVFAQDSYTSVSTHDLTIRKSLDTHQGTPPKHSVNFVTTFKSKTPSDAGYTGSVPTQTLTFFDSGDSSTVKHADLELSELKFNTPGVFTFEVKESIQSGVPIYRKEGTESFYTVEVYVIDTGETDSNGNHELAVEKVYTFKGSETKTGEERTKVGDTLEFENYYDRYHFSVKKSVEGNFGDKSKEFRILVYVKNTISTDRIIVKRQTGSPKAGSSKLDLSTGDYTINGGGTTVSIELYLKDQDSVVLEGLNGNATVRVFEDSTYSGGYTVTYDPSNIDSSSSSDYVLAKSLNGQTVTVNNKKQSTVPTGLFLNNWPYITVVVIALLGCIFFIRRRKARYDYEADL